jgi:hypothetical protein
VTYYSKIGRVVASLLLLLGGAATRAQAPGGAKPAEKATEKPASADKASEEASFPFQIQLLETKVRFEANGDSRKEVHTIVKLNDLMGVREFARLTFDYNRSFQQVEIPLVRVTHANGGTSDVLPSAITDAPNPAVEKYPAYQDVRVKSVRILGLQEGDSIEYRVITITTHHPLAPDFWAEHSFDKSGQVAKEQYEVNIPDLPVDIQINPATPAKIEHENNANTIRSVYRWERNSPAETSHSEVTSENASKPDVALSTYPHWRVLSAKLANALTPGSTVPDPSKSREEQYKELADAPVVPKMVSMKATDLIASAKNDMEKTRAIYDFVSTKITTVDLPLGATGFSVRASDEILASGYATQEDKFVLLSALAKGSNWGVTGMLIGFSDARGSKVPRPSVFKHIIALGGGPRFKWCMDPSLEVAPLGLITPIKEEFVFSVDRANNLPSRLPPDSSFGVWQMAPKGSPFPAFQKVGVNATLGENGKLSAKVKYTLRGDNELLLRVAFHQTAKEKWKDVAGLLALSDGFRGVITSVEASDPMATKDPFTVEYELTQEKFVDWAKKPVRIPALLPQIGLPDISAKTSAGNIGLGTPLDVETQLTLHLPAGTTVQTPAGSSVERDYATYSSKYGMSGETLSAARHIHFLRREVAGDRAADYNAFAQAVQNDQAQYFVLDRGVGVKSAAKE